MPKYFYSCVDPETNYTGCRCRSALSIRDFSLRTWHNSSELRLHLDLYRPHFLFADRIWPSIYCMLLAWNTTTSMVSSNTYMTFNCFATCISNVNSLCAFTYNSAIKRKRKIILRKGRTRERYRQVCHAPACIEGHNKENNSTLGKR